SATAHHYEEVVTYRLTAGVLGLLVLGAYRVARRRLRPGVGVLPDGFVPTIGVAAFGVAAAGLLLDGLGQLPAGYSHGAGQYLSGGIVALVACGFFLRALVRVLSVRDLRAAGPG